MERTASVLWRGDIKQGKGEINTPTSGVLKHTPYSFSTRFEGTPGTNPEELIAAAHASCFAMATAVACTKKGHAPVLLDVEATVQLRKQGDSWAVTSSHLQLTADVPGMSEAEFQALARDAKENCPVSKLLKAEITLDAHLESSPVEINLPH